MGARVTVLLVVCCLVVGPVAAQEVDIARAPTMVVLDVEGQIDFARAGWALVQPLQAGTLVHVKDFVYSDGDAVVLVMCPDGSTREFLSSELLPVDVLDCHSDPSNAIIGDPGSQRLLIQRGGRQDPTIPYLIAPRATVVRSEQVTLRWNAVPAVDHYTVTVRGSGDTWQSADLDPADVVQGDEATLELPIVLQPDVPYTVEICVLFDDMRQGCTSDPGWSSGDVAFYYKETPVLDAAETRLIRGLGEETPESLYARAVLFSQPVFEIAPDLPVGAYQDAVELLTRLLRAYPDSALASSPELYNLLGELYRRMALPINAARAYEQAAALATPHTEAAATAALGRAMTTPAGDEVALYSEALEHYAAFMNHAAFDEQFASICKQAGGLCLQLPQCTERLRECAVWARDDG
jgi:hypothetical protein